LRSSTVFFVHAVSLPPKVSGGTGFQSTGRSLQQIPTGAPRSVYSGAMAQWHAYKRCIHRFRSPAHNSHKVTAIKHRIAASGPISG
jgi:hypothetical protein